ncbi:alpha/beta fold hydrolase [Williamsia sp. MIQD14]|uniref:alpha/beta fold hydrolase n=1 Tax=Williamsia sp. MIQD14 TaxID=3425703 RepID=UPI003DA15FF2
MTPPPDVTIREVTTGGVVLPVEHSGPTDGVPVVLLHGWPQNARGWDRVVPILHDAGFTTVVPSLRGAAVGATPRSRLCYRPHLLCADVEAIIADVGAPVHLVGHDWGAALAWTVACRRPDLLTTVTAVSVPHPATFARALSHSRQILSSWYMLVFQLPVIPELILSRRNMLARFLIRSGQTPELAARDARAAAAPGVLHGGINWYRGFILSREAAPATTTVPVLQVWSDGDIAIRRSTVEATSRHAVGGFEFLAVTRVSHWIPDERPDELAQAIIRHADRTHPTPT